ncbi:MAG: ATP-binding protein, partial [Candidatus Ferrigenium altingense]
DSSQAVGTAEKVGPTVILLDLNMPGIDGLTVCHFIRAHPATRDIPVIMLSSNDDPATKAAAFAAGANDYIVKLPDAIELVARLRYHSASYINKLQRDDAYRALRASQMKLEEINMQLQQLASFPRMDPNPVIEVNAAREITYLNPAAEKLFPDLAAKGLEHPLLKGQQIPFELFEQGEQREVVFETVLGERTYEQHAYYVEESSLIRIRVLDITARKAAEAERRRLSEAVEQALEAIVLTDAERLIVYANPAFARLFGYSAQEVIGQPVELLTVAGGSYPSPLQVSGVAREQEAFSGETLLRCKDGRTILVLLNVAVIRDEHNEISGYVGTMNDLTELKRIEVEARQRLEELTLANTELRELNAKLEQAQSQLMQSEKMASVGLLAAGVAHEINNPIGYIQSNLGTLETYVKKFLAVLDAYEKAELSIPDREKLFAGLAELKKGGEIAYLKQDVVALLSESQEGIDRVKKIVESLKAFSRINVNDEWGQEDIHHGLDSTLNVIWSELKYKCEVVKEYGVLPPVECLLAQLNQVFMNLLINAAQAMETRGTITIRTGVRDDQIWIEIADNGKGIPPENLSRIFDPFFTTKPVGTGTGLGLSVSFNIIQKHHGRIEVESAEGRGSTFRVWLPVRQHASDDGALVEGG